MSTEEKEVVVTKELDKIIKFLKNTGYSVDRLGGEDTEEQLVVNGQKNLDYIDEDEETYVNLGTIKIKIVFDDTKSSGTKKRIIKHKKTTRRKRKTKK